MAAFTIEIFEFALLVHRPVGLTVLFPSKSHALTVTVGGVTVPIGPGTAVVLADAQGVPLPGSPTTVANPGAFVFDLLQVVQPPVRVPAATLTSTTVDPSLLNARIVLSGGTLTELDKHDGPMTWVFDNGLTRPVTDRAEFTHDIGAGETMHLVVNDVALPIHAGDRLVLRNQDVIGGPFGEFVELQEFELLCEIVQAIAAPPPVRFRGGDGTRFTTLGNLKVFEAAAFYGTDFVCAVGSINSDV